MDVLSSRVLVRPATWTGACASAGKLLYQRKTSPYHGEAGAGIRRAGQRVQFGGHVGGFGRTDPLQDRQRVPQLVFGLGGAGRRPGRTGQAGQRVRLLQGDAELAGQVQGLLVA